jgi:hypothetical protein
MAAAPEGDAAHEFNEKLTREAQRRGCAVFLLDSPDSNEPTLQELRALPKLFAPKAAAEDMAAVAEELGMVRGQGWAAVCGLVGSAVLKSEGKGWSSRTPGKGAVV